MQITPKPKYVASNPNNFDSSGNNFTTRNTVRNAAQVTQPEVIPKIEEIRKINFKIVNRI